MALMECKFFSRKLMLQTSMFVYIPTPTMDDENFGRLQQYFEEGKKYPTLYLLHGLSDDHSAWLRNTSIERYAEAKKIAIVMPAADHSFYTDMAYGKPYYSYFSEELPQIARMLFPLSSKREDNFVAGLSMGGYGAFKLALSSPDKYAAAASLSGALNLYKVANSLAQKVHKGSPTLLPLHQVAMNAFGNMGELSGTEHDLNYLAERVKESNTEIPKLYQCCGTEDYVYEVNEDFKDFTKKIGLDLTYEEGPGGHDWSYWDTQIQRVLQWLPVKS
ncbi:alpha/beta hydrolase [Paenibacillus sophorae]|uniref:Esterase family protein n=2 Tax=Paenibacillus sophorae TaxID=1333845 RepID=A0ABX8HIL2_9BACL|nr:alpha/beta hydrolase family protein [Paenibacillus sophorae]QWU16567.1 esterase family protein [Paenibacillus sophorae]